MKLFAAQGYDNVTTDQIAERAGVSTRTFFRYFPTKEAVTFLGGDNIWVNSFVEIYLEQPSAMPDLDAICAALVELSFRFVHDRTSSRLFERVVISSPTLRGRLQERQEEDAKHIAKAIAARRGLTRADEASLLLADIGLLTNRRALVVWRERNTGELGDVIVEEFALLKDSFMKTTASSPPRSEGSRSRTRAGSR